MGKASISPNPNGQTSAKKDESQRGKQSIIKEETYESMSVASSAVKTS